MIILDDNQLEAVSKLRTGSVLCGGVGSGKSRTAIMYFFTKVLDGQMEVNGIGQYKPPTFVKKLYIITTAAKRDSQDWQKECVPFLINDIVTVDSWNNITKYIDVRDAFFIFDEQHVSSYGLWARCFIKIARRNDWILCSATPGDKWEDYISIFIANGFYRNKTEFEQRHIVYNPFLDFKKVQKYLDVETLMRLRKQILVNIKFIRHTTRIDRTIHVKYDKEKYDYILKERWNVFEDKPVENISELCSLLRKVANSDSSRIEAIKEILKEHDRCIIFYNFDYELEILREFCNSIGIIFGERNSHKHNPFPEGDKWIYLVQYSSGSEALNCITSDTIIFYSLSYSYRMVHQACGRIDRRNTPYKQLYYYKLVSMAPIDCEISNTLSNKKEFNEKAYIEKIGLKF